MYKILPNILLSRLTPYAEKIIGDHQVNYWSYSLFGKYLKKTEYEEAVHQLYIDFREAYVSVRRDVLYKILITFVILMKSVRLMKGIWIKPVTECG
jgi:hypothetical protein